MRHRAGLVLKPGRHLDVLDLSKLFQNVNFAHMLGLKEAELAQYDPKHGIVTHHTVTPYYCRTDAHGRAYLSAGVALALFDEISTCAAMVQDRAHRPGVSVSLEAHMLQHVPAGSRVKITAWADKMGRTLAFLSMKMEDEDSGQLLAVGRHVKFLPLGLAWDLAMAPWLYPLARGLIQQEAQKLVTKGEAVGVSSQSSLYSSFGYREEEGAAVFKVESRHCNGFGKCHGGAVAVLAEDVAIRQYKQAHGRTPVAHFMSLSYLNAIAKGHVTISSKALDQPAAAGGATGGGGAPSVTEMELHAGTTLCNQATIVWEQQQPPSSKGANDATRRHAAPGAPSSGQ